MRRILTLVLLLLVFGSIPATARVTCTILGTRHDDVLRGTSGVDSICGFGGNDYENGYAGADVVKGGRGNDLLVGGSGQDRLGGRRGNDRLLAVDNRPLDQLKGGPGSDTCHVDIGDSFERCEHIDVARPLLSQNLMMVPFSSALVTWLHNHKEGADGAG